MNNSEKHKVFFSNSEFGNALAKEMREFHTRILEGVKKSTENANLIEVFERYLKVEERHFSFILKRLLLIETGVFEDLRHELELDPDSNYLDVEERVGSPRFLSNLLALKKRVSEAHNGDGDEA